MQDLYQIRVNYPFFGAVKADGRWQRVEGKKDFNRKGGYQDGFGITKIRQILLSIAFSNHS
jgi:hypothetical protein